MAKRINLLIVAAFIAIGCFFWSISWQLPPDDPGMEEVGIGMFPRFCVYCIIGLSSIVAFSELAFSAQPEKSAAKIDRGGKARIALLFFMLLLFAIFFEWIGFFPGAYIFCFFTLIMLGEKNWWVRLFYPVGLLLFVYVVFIKIMGITLPAGELTDYFFM